LNEAERCKDRNKGTAGTPSYNAATLHKALITFTAHTMKQTKNEALLCCNFVGINFIKTV